MPDNIPPTFIGIAYYQENTMSDLVQFLKDNGASLSVMEWVLAQPDQSLEALWKTCPNGEWMVWLHEKAGTEFEILAPVVYRSVTRTFNHANIYNGRITQWNIGLALEAAEFAVSFHPKSSAAKIACITVGAALTREASYALRCESDMAREKILAFVWRESAARAAQLQAAEDCRELLPLPTIKRSGICRRTIKLLKRIATI